MGGTSIKPEGMAGERAMFTADIEIIAHSPLGKTPAGQKIVSMLRRYAEQNNITYGETQGDRAAVDSQITVNKDYYGNLCKTVTALVHEASHAVWRAAHPIRKGHPESLGEAVDNELYAETNELIIYQWLKDVKKLCQPDPELDLRLDRKARGTLRSTIDARERENRGQ